MFIDQHPIALMHCVPRRIDGRQELPIVARGAVVSGAEDFCREAEDGAINRLNGQDCLDPWRDERNHILRLRGVFRGQVKLRRQALVEEVDKGGAKARHHGRNPDIGRNRQQERHERQR